MLVPTLLGLLLAAHARATPSLKDAQGQIRELNQAFVLKTGDRRAKTAQVEEISSREYAQYYLGISPRLQHGDPISEQDKTFADDILRRMGSARSRAETLELLKQGAELDPDMRALTPSRRAARVEEMFGEFWRNKLEEIGAAKLAVLISANPDPAVRLGSKQSLLADPRIHALVDQAVEVENGRALTPEALAAAKTEIESLADPKEAEKAAVQFKAALRDSVDKIVGGLPEGQRPAPPQVELYLAGRTTNFAEYREGLLDRLSGSLLGAK